MGPPKFSARMSLRSCGDRVFASGMANATNLRHYRVQNELDLVTRVPYWTPYPGAYAHFQSVHVWLRGNQVMAEGDQPIKAASAPLNLFYWLIRWIWRDNKAGISAHKMVNPAKKGYVEKLERWSSML